MGKAGRGPPSSCPQLSGDNRSAAGHPQPTTPKTAQPSLNGQVQKLHALLHTSIDMQDKFNDHMMTLITQTGGCGTCTGHNQQEGQASL